MTDLATTQTHQALSGPQLKLIKNSLARDCNDDEFDLFIEMARRHGLDPIRKQIYAIVINKNNPKKRQLVVVTGIDGYRVKAARCGDYRPDENETVYEYDKELKDPKTNPLGLVKATVKCFKLDPNGKWNPVTGVSYWDEFAPLKEIWEENAATGRREPSGKLELDRSGNWHKMPRIMLAKTAESQALRRGWPEEFSGLYVAEELDSALSASEEVELVDTEQRLALVAPKDAIPLQFEIGQPIEYVPAGQFADSVMEFLKKATEPQHVDTFRNINQNGLREFWAGHKSDALELKAQMEEREAELAVVEEPEIVEAEAVEAKPVEETLQSILGDALKKNDQIEPNTPTEDALFPPLSPDQVDLLQRNAREAATKGWPAFNEYWKQFEGRPDEQAAIKQIDAEIRALADGAD